MFLLALLQWSAISAQNSLGQLIFQDRQKHASGTKTDVLINDVSGFVILRLHCGEHSTLFVVNFVFIKP